MALAEAGLTPVLQRKFDRAKPDFSVIAPEVAKANLQAVLFFGAGGAVADGTRALRAAGSKAQVITLSNNASGGFIKAMGEHARGTIVTQVFPYERSLAAPIVREAAELSQAQGMEISAAMMEGFAAAKVLVEALRRAATASGGPTRESITAALNNMRALDIGGMELSYSPTDHTGLTFADLSIIDAAGKFRR